MKDSFGMLWAKSAEDLQGKWGNAILTSLFAVLIYGHAGAAAVFLSPLNFGFYLFFLNISKRSHAEFGQLFLPFRQYWRIVWGAFRPALFTFLWTLLFVIPGIIAAYRYILTPYIMLEYPQMPVKEAMQQSALIMQGHKFRFFCYQILFSLLTLAAIIFTLGAGLLWTVPFSMTFAANFYRIRKETFIASNNQKKDEK